MPEMRRYVVTQTREVHVTANDSEAAVRIAKAAFDNGQNIDNGVIKGPEGVWGNTDTQIRETEMYARLQR